MMVSVPTTTAAFAAALLVELVVENAATMKASQSKAPLSYSK